MALAFEFAVPPDDTVFIWASLRSEVDADRPEQLVGPVAWDPGEGAELVLGDVASGEDLRLRVEARRSDSSDLTVGWFGISPLFAMAPDVSAVESVVVPLETPPASSMGNLVFLTRADEGAEDVELEPWSEAFSCEAATDLRVWFLVQPAVSGVIFSGDPQLVFDRQELDLDGSDEDVECTPVPATWREGLETAAFLYGGPWIEAEEADRLCLYEGFDGSAGPVDRMIAEEEAESPETLELFMEDLESWGPCSYATSMTYVFEDTLGYASQAGTLAVEVDDVGPLVEAALVHPEPVVAGETLTVTIVTDEDIAAASLVASGAEPDAPALELEGPTFLGLSEHTLRWAAPLPPEAAGYDYTLVVDLTDLAGNGTGPMVVEDEEGEALVVSVAE